MVRMVQTLPLSDVALERDPGADDSGAAPRRRRPDWRALLRLGRVGGVVVLIAFVVTAGLELVHGLTVPGVGAPTHLIGLQRNVFWLGVGVVGAVVVLLHALTNRLWLAGTLTALLAGLLAFSDYHKVVQREEPLFPTDLSLLSQPGFLLDAVGVHPALAVAVALVVVAALVGVEVLLRRRRRDRPRLLGRRARWVTRVVAGVLALVVLLLARGFNEPGNPLRSAYDNAGVLWKPWQQPSNYAINGFVAGFLFNMPADAMDRPEGYSEAAMAEIVDRYAAAAAAVNADRDPGALTDTNVVVVLAETFSDPLAMDGVSMADPIPYHRELWGQVPAGTMLSSGYGGGTANVEFEVLTGMALSNFQAQMRVPYQSLLSTEEDHFPSFVDHLGDDHRTLAIHPYLSSFYQRDDVYEVLGIERATFIEEMTHRRFLANDNHVADSATFDELVDELAAEEAPMFVNVVTMQNHQPFDGLYPDPVPVDGDFPPAEGEGLRQYVTGLHETDAALRELVADLEALGERTVVLYYGDHLAAVWPQSVLDANPPQAQWTTPWFVWSSFEGAPVEPRATLGPNFLVNQLLAAANAPVTPLNALLEELSQEVGAYEPTMILDADGNVVTEDDLSPRAQELLEDYRMVQYDLSIGERYAAEQMLSVPTRP